MKLRKLVSMCALALLVVAVLAVPAQAAPPQTEEFIAVDTDFVWIDSVERLTGNASHYINTWYEVVDSPDPRFRGTLSSEYVCNGTQLNHPNPTEWPGWGLVGWGPCRGVWKLEVTADSGWVGQGAGLPQSDYRQGMGTSTGVGYGTLKGMTVKWYQVNLTEWGVLRHVTILQDK